MNIRLKRIYEPREDADGLRILVDRLWPRGITKERAHIDRWLKEIAPSNELRRWFAHKPERWKEFRRRYWNELNENRPVVRDVLELCRQQETVTLLYSARDEQHNQAVALKGYLAKHLPDYPRNTGD